MIRELETMNNIYTNMKSIILEQQIAALLPKHVSVEQFIRTAATALLENQELQYADKQSLILALTQCAKDGLLPDGREAALVVRSAKVNNQFIKKAVYIPMVDGVLKRARQSQEISSIFVDVVHEGDIFKRWTDERGKHFKHEPNDTDERGEIRLVYAAAKLKNGDFLMDVMLRSDVEKIRDTVRSGKDPHSPWMKWFDRMALKTVIHRLARRLPCASELFSMFEVQEEDSSVAETSITKSSVAPPRRLSIVDALRERAEKRAQDLKQKQQETVRKVSPESQSSISPQLRTALTALDNTTDEKNFARIVEQCNVLCTSLSEDEQHTLREKIKTTQNRLIQPKKDSETRVVRLANGSGDAWRFPDGEIIHGFFKAKKKAKKIGMILEEQSQYRFSPSH